METLLTPEFLAQAERLVDALRQGNAAAAQEALLGLSDARESMLLREIGSLTRDLHEALRQFSADSRIEALTAEDMPDARERLRYVASLTEQAAHRTLAAAEQALPLTDSLIRRSQGVAERLRALREPHAGHQVLQDLMAPSLEVDLASVKEDAEQVRAQLNEIILAQAYQDLTGQLLHRVILLLERLEGEMLKLIRLVGSSGVTREAPPDAATRAEGPALPSAGAGVVRGQDEVDDLLASLGF